MARKTLFKIRKHTWLAIGLVIMAVPFILFRFLNPGSSSAAWFDNNWQFRKPINIPSHTTEENNVYVTVPTFDATDTARFQSDCGDLRFTKENGQLLKYYVVDCDATANINVLFDTLPAGESNYYMYYGNPSAANGFQSSNFTTAASGLGSQALGSEANGPGPVASWSFDEGTGQTINDSTQNANNGTLGADSSVASDDPTWLAEDQCLSGKCLYYDGTDDLITVTNTPSIDLAKNMAAGFTFQTWVRPTGEGSGNKKLLSKGADTWLKINNLSGGNLDIQASLNLSTTDATVTVSAKVQNNKWNQISFSYTDDADDEITIWVNGESAGSSTNGSGSAVAGTVPTTNTENFNGGVFSNANTFAAADLDICVWGFNIQCGYWENDMWVATIQSNNKKDGTVGIDLGSEQTVTAASMYTQAATGGRSRGMQFRNSSLAYITGSQQATFGTGTYTWPSGNVNGVRYITYFVEGDNYPYIDNLSVTSETTDTTTPTGDGVKGFIDETKIYNYARSAAQIKTDFQKGSAAIGSAAVFGQQDTSFLNNGLVGYWKMDEASWTNNCSTDTVLDASGNGKNGDACPNSTGPTGGAVGKFGNGGNFDGSDDYVNVGAISLGSTAGTMHGWAKFDTIPDGSSGAYIIGRNYDNEALGIIEDAGFHALAEFGTKFCADYDASLSSGVWYSLTATYDGSKIRLYVNGELVETCNQTATLTHAQPWAIGSWQGDDATDRLFDGAIDDVRLYNRTLSPVEIKNLYNWAPGPIGYWNFDENAGSTSYDKSTHGFNLNNGATNTYQRGKYGGALSSTATGTGPSLTYAADSALDFTSTSHPSVSFWLQSSTSHISRLIEAPVSGGFGVEYTNTTLNMINFGGTVATFANAMLFDGAWHHYELTFDGTTTIFYRDGVSQGTSTDLTGGWTSGSKTLYLAGDASYPLNGLLDDVKIYNYARSSAQIIEDMNGGHTIGGSPVGSQAIYWALDEQQGTTANNTTSGNTNGTISNALWKTKSNCKTNGCLLFDGTGDVITIATASDSNVDFNTSEQFSGSAWIYVTTMPGSGEQDAIITKWDATSSQRGYRLYVENDDADSTGNFEVEIYDESTDQTIRASGTTDSVSQNTWYHLSFTFSGGIAGAANDLKLYVNGGNTASNAVNASFLGLEDITADFAVGEYDITDVVATNTGFTGYIDEVKVYAALLTDEHIKIDYNAGASLNVGTTANSEASTLSDGAGNPPMLYLNFDEHTGSTANDTSTYSTAHNGTITNPEWVPGKVGSALSFNGSNSTASVTDSNDFNSAGATYEMWVKISRSASSVGADQSIAIHAHNASPFRSFWFYQASGDDALGAYIYNQAGSGAFIGGPVLSPNVWYHLAITWDLTNARLYINGIQYGSPTALTGTTVYDANQNFCIGSNNCVANYFNGIIDDVKVYAYGRTQAQVAYDYNRGAPIGYWQFDECQGSIAYDGSGNGNNGTWSGSGGGSQTAVGTCNTSSTAWGNGATGKYNASLNFDGTDDYMDMGDPASGILDFGANQNFTISGWFNKASGNDGVLVTKRLSAGGGATEAGYSFYTNNITELRFRVADGGSALHTGVYSGAFSLGSWNHFVLIIDKNGGGTTALYVNGNLLTETSGGGAAFTASIANAQPFRIGTDASANTPFTGKIDDVRVFNYGLSASQVKQLYNQGSSVRFGPSEGSP